MSRSLPPPAIPGLTHLEKLGAGGYADVYLYEQEMPARKVAVKVLREWGLSATAVSKFTAEANAMARLEHPHIVPVYAAGVTPDGRPYIVMMYYPRANLSERLRRERLSVAEVLRIGIQIGSAVETAHRAGLLHRDIKPANILGNQYGAPGLTDFGIAAQIAEADDEDLGVSVPWSPPETLFGTQPAGVASDVYSLAATLWHLLVGRSPFEIPGGDNTPFALMRRIRDTPAPSSGRPDVPASLDRLLRSALSREPGARPASAIQLVRSLQSIEQELRLERTPLVLAEDTPPTVRPQRSDVADRTRIKSVQVVRPEPAVLSTVPVQALKPGSEIDQASVHSAERTMRRSDGASSPVPLMALPAEVTRTRAALPPASVEEIEGPRKPPWFVAVLAVAVIAAIIGFGLVLGSQQGTSAPTTSTMGSRTFAVPDIGDEQLPPGKLRITAAKSGGSVIFTWGAYDHMLESDSYGWRPEGGAERISETPEVTVPLLKGTTCIEVRVLRADGSHAQDYSSHCYP